MIERSEIEERAARDGVPDAQVWRDWMISHVLHALSTIQDEVPLTFYGGTALCRTWCPDLRYSEDVDLLVSDFDSATEAIPLRLRQLLRREFADLEWSAAAARDRMVSALLTAAARSIKVQLVEPRIREEAIPTAPTAVDLRYSDLPTSAQLTVPTPEGFAAMKLMAWHQRQAPRDLVDLDALARAEAITERSIDLTEHVSGVRIGARVLDHRITPTVVDAWRPQLNHQMAEVPDPNDCLNRVVDAVRRVDRSAPPG